MQEELARKAKEEQERQRQREEQQRKEEQERQRQREEQQQKEEQERQRQREEQQRKEEQERQRQREEQQQREEQERKRQEEAVATAVQPREIKLETAVPAALGMGVVRQPPDELGGSLLEGRCENNVREIDKMMRALDKNSDLAKRLKKIKGRFLAIQGEINVADNLSDADRKKCEEQIESTEKQVAECAAQIDRLVQAEVKKRGEQEIKILEERIASAEERMREQTKELRGESGVGEVHGVIAKVDVLLNEMNGIVSKVEDARNALKKQIKTVEEKERAAKESKGACERARSSTSANEKRVQQAKLTIEIIEREDTKVEAAQKSVNDAKGQSQDVQAKAKRALENAEKIRATVLKVLALLGADKAQALLQKIIVAEEKEAKEVERSKVLDDSDRECGDELSKKRGPTTVKYDVPEVNMKKAQTELRLAEERARCIKSALDNANRRLDEDNKCENKARTETEKLKKDFEEALKKAMEQCERVSRELEVTQKSLNKATEPLRKTNEEITRLKQELTAVKSRLVSK